jgi:hypothetical protein
MADDNAQLNVTELIATLLMGLAAVAIAWSTYQSALWGGQQDEANTESVRHASKVVDLLQVGDRIKALDQLLFIEVLTSHTCDGDEQGDRIACATVASAGRFSVWPACSSWAQPRTLSVSLWPRCPADAPNSIVRL